MGCALLLSMSCKKDAPGTSVQEPVAPVVESASLRGAEGETSVPAGSSVVFKAVVSVTGSELEAYSIDIRKGTELLASASGDLSGTGATIEETLELALNPADVSEDFFPDVVLKVTNTDKMYVEKVLSNEESIRITVPDVPDRLYLVDNAGHIYEMSASADRGRYHTTAEISEMGTSFSVAEAVSTDGSIDESGKSWKDISVPESEYGLKWIGFDIFTEEVYKMIDHTVTLDMSAMADDNPYKVFWSQNFVQDCEVEFLNYPDGMQLQGDRFADAEGNTARYTGTTENNLEVYYLPEPNWLVVKFQWSDTESMWLTGENGALPMLPYSDGLALNWFNNVPNSAVSTTTMSFVKEDDSNWRMLLYLKDNFAIKVFDGFSWANEINPWSSMTPETLVITGMEQTEDGTLDGNYGNAGPSFSEGLYMLHFDSSNASASLVRYNGTVPSISAD